VAALNHLLHGLSDDIPLMSDYVPRFNNAQPRLALGTALSHLTKGKHLIATQSAQAKLHVLYD
jgi:hypothetical protein